MTGISPFLPFPVSHAALSAVWIGNAEARKPYQSGLRMEKSLENDELYGRDVMIALKCKLGRQNCL